MARLHLITMALLVSASIISCKVLAAEQNKTKEVSKSLTKDAKVQDAENKKAEDSQGEEAKEAAKDAKAAKFAATSSLNNFKRPSEATFNRLKEQSGSVRNAQAKYEIAQYMGAPAYIPGAHSADIFPAHLGFGKKLLSEENMNDEVIVEEEATNRKLLQPGVYHGPVVNHIRRDVARRQVRLGVRQGRPIAGIASAAGVMHGGWPRLHAHPFLG